jgi:hypothetical protein
MAVAGGPSTKPCEPLSAKVDTLPLASDTARTRKLPVSPTNNVVPFTSARPEGERNMATPSAPSA